MAKQIAFADLLFDPTQALDEFQRFANPVGSGLRIEECTARVRPTLQSDRFLSVFLDHDLVATSRGFDQFRSPNTLHISPNRPETRVPPSL